MEKLEKRKTKIYDKNNKNYVITENYDIQDIVDKINEIIEALNEITKK